MTLTTLVLATDTHAFGEWWQCASRTGGEWHFGRTPSVCLVNHMQTQSFVSSQYGPNIFTDSAPRTAERKRYMTEINAVAKDILDYYFSKRKPNASQSEKDAFLWGFRALMHQETLWSHYRKPTDGQIRYMRGDVGHGHGIMQVDDRSHQAALLEGKGADMIQNMIYGLDVYFGEWQRAPSQSCVNGPTDYYARIRSAWSAYNGGPGSICRWTNPGSAHANKDKDFKLRLDQKLWNSYINDFNHKTILDVTCLAEGQRPCANTGSQPDVIKAEEGHLYLTSENNYCLFKEGQFECVSLLDDVNCLQLREQVLYPLAAPISDSVFDKHPKQNLDRHNLCLTHVTGLHSVSNNLKLLKNINLRKKPGGELLTTLKANTTYSNLDFRVQSTQDQKRYYKVSHNELTGYIYAGDQSDFHQWVEKAEIPEPTSIIAQAGESVKIVATYGINLRKTPGGTYIGRLSKDSEVEVFKSHVQGSKNYLYYQVSTSLGVGYIYSGYLDKAESIKDWTEILVNNESFYKLSSNIPYRFLRTCPSFECEQSQQALVSDIIPSKTDKVIVQKTHDSWSQVQSLTGFKTGWILTSELMAY